MATDLRFPGDNAEVLESVIGIVENSGINDLLKERLLMKLKNSLLIPKSLFNEGDRVTDSQDDISEYIIGTPVYFPKEEEWKYLDYNSEYLLNEFNLKPVEVEE